MAVRFECEESALLCCEVNEEMFCGDDEICGVKEQTEVKLQHRNHRILYGGGFFVGVLPGQSEECLNLLLEKEIQHMPCNDYLTRLKNRDLDLGARTEIIDWIEKVHAHFNFGPLCLYLSINYMNRFLSSFELPNGKAWMMQLLAVTCLSLAAKIEETEVPLSLDLQIGEAKFIFEAKTIQKMELLVLSTLKWRMQAITPFSFIDHFICKINDVEIPPRTLILQSIQLILSTIKGIDFLEFKPSEISAAVAIYVSGQTQKVDFEKAISFITDHVEKDKVNKCIEKIHDLLSRTSSSNGVATSVPMSPIGVLDAGACLSYRSDGSPSWSRPNSTHNSPHFKKRKLNNPFKL